MGFFSFLNPVRNIADDIGSAFTGQPAHSPSVSAPQPTPAPITPVQNPVQAAAPKLNLAQMGNPSPSPVNTTPAGTPQINPGSQPHDTPSLLSHLGHDLHNWGSNVVNDGVKPLVNMTGIPSAIDTARLGAAEYSGNQPAINAATDRLATNVPQVLPIAVAESIKPFAQDVATAATAPYAEHVAQQQADLARKELGGVSDDPAYKAAVESYADAVATDLLNKHLQTAGVDMNTPTGELVRKVVGAGTEAGANIAMAGSLDKLTAGGLPTAALFGGLNAASGLASVAQEDNPQLSDYLKAGLASGLEGVALPVIVHGATKFAGNIKLNPVKGGVGGATFIEPERAVGEDTPQPPQESTPNTRGMLPIVADSKSPTVQLERIESGSLPNDTPIPSNTPFNPAEYVEEQTAKQEAARQGEKGSLTTRLNGAKTDLRAKFIDSFAPIEDKIDAAKRAGVPIDPQQDIRYAIDRALRADTIGSQYIRDNGFDKIIQNVPDTKAFDQYLIAKHAQDLEASGIKTGRNLAKDQKLIAALHDEYEPYAEQLRAYTHGLLDKTAEYGLIPHDMPEQLKQQYPNYVPAQRIFAEDELPQQRGNGAGKASISKQTVVQGIKGSTREIESPLNSILHKTQDVISQGERNNAARILASYKDLPDNPLGIVPLRTAEDVKARIDLFGQAKELRPIQRKLEQLVSTRARWARRLQSEIDKLNDKGLNESLKQNREAMPNFAPGGLGGKLPTSQAGKVVSITPEEKTIMRLSGSTNLDVPTNPSMLGPKDTRAFLNSLVNLPSSKLEQIKTKIATRENKLGPVLDELSSLSDAAHEIRQNRIDLIKEGRSHADLSATNKHTFSVLNDGIKETYETTPEVAAAAKSLNKEQLGLLGKVLSYPTRILRLGATSLNPAFSLANLSKDQVSAFINSDHALKTSVANPRVFMLGLKAAFNHGGDEYAELLREGAGGTSFDIARDQPVKNIQVIRANKNIGTRAVYQLQHPVRSVSDLITAAENTIGRTEEMTRAMQYFGNKAALLKEGKSPTEARLMAAHAARNNTVNFARAGEYGRVLNSVLPYLNAGIQGSRTLLRNLREHPAQTATKIAITSFLPVAATTAWNLSDPERKKAYDSIKEYEKQNNIIIVPPHPTQDKKTGRWNVIKIPVSQEIANLNNIVRNGVEQLHKDTSFNFGALAGDLAGTVTSLNVGSARQALNQVTPQAVKPLVENATNQNLFTGAQIVPDAQKNLAPGDQFNKSTSGTAKFIGKALGISPLQIDNTIRTTTGGLGQNIVNLTDKGLAATGVIPKSDVHGTPFLQAVTNRFDSAAGATPGSEYFTNLEQVAKDQHLSGKNYQLLNALTAKETDQNGNPVPTDLTTKLENSAIRASNPEIMAVETAAAKLTAQQTGQPLDPFYNLTPDQQKTVTVIEARKALDNSDEQAALMKEQNPWIDQFYKDRAAYFQQQDQQNGTDVAINADGTRTTTKSDGTQTTNSTFNMPAATDQVANDMNGAKGLTGADYANYMKSHPELTDYYAQLDKAVRSQHDYFNEPQYKEYPTPSTRVQQILNDSASMTPQQKSAAFKDPEVSNYLADIGMWQTNKAGDRNQYEGQDYTQKDLKNLYSIGNYDVVKNADGTYSQIAGHLGNGQALAGFGSTTGGSAGYTANGSPDAPVHTTGSYKAKTKHIKVRRIYFKNKRPYEMKIGKHTKKNYAKVAMNVSSRIAQPKAAKLNLKAPKVNLNKQTSA